MSKTNPENLSPSRYMYEIDKCKHEIHSPSTGNLISCIWCEHYFKEHCIIDDIGEDE